MQQKKKFWFGGGGIEFVAYIHVSETRHSTFFFFTQLKPINQPNNKQLLTDVVGMHSQKVNFSGGVI